MTPMIEKFTEEAKIQEESKEGVEKRVPREKENGR